MKTQSRSSTPMEAVKGLNDISDDGSLGGYSVVTGGIAYSGNTGDTGQAGDSGGAGYTGELGIMSPKKSNQILLKHVL